ncbi:hypothetical protein ONE63_002846 [Megalurothrips usitatus]|uniref:Uncharacterized protein n=1 Tax=Megalurothrips usitatus TaxID=439358 RepID=A0AAV7XC37_9NEOP|nr:hypothetical protein ONE63_002846 [Megalurothrips usitatus]
MSIPLFPSLRPNIMCPFWGELDPPVDEEAEIIELEREQREWKASLGQMFGNPLPIGKTSNDPDEEDLEAMADEDDDTTSSDDIDDMAPRGMFRIHDNLSPPPPPVVAPAAPLIPDSPASPSDDTSSVTSSTSSESTVTVTLNRIAGPSTSTAQPQGPPESSAGRATRVIVGRHIPAPRPGMPQQPARYAYIETTSRRIFSGRRSSGSVSPPNQTYMEAMFRSATGEANSDDSAGSGDEGTAPAPQHAPPATRPFPEYISQFHQMSSSSSQIDSLIESVYQAQRATSSGAGTSNTSTTPSASVTFNERMASLTRADVVSEITTSTESIFGSESTESGEC